MRLSEFIKNNIEIILNEWEAFARSLPPGGQMDVAQLRDHAREILETIVEDMTSSQTDTEQNRKARGKGRLMALALDFARKHANRRHEEGFNVNQVVAEYRALRASIIRLWTQEAKTVDADALYELTRFNEEIDQAMTYSVEEFTLVAERGRQAILDDFRESETRSRAIAESLQQATRNKDEFLAILAHELRNPLAPVQTGIEVLSMMESMPRSTEPLLNIMQRQMVHIVRLVEDLLDVSRISQGKISLHKESVAIADIIHKAMEVTAPYINAGNRKVTVELSTESLIVEGDAVRLTQILGNLLSNAGKHTDVNGQIWITVMRDGSEARIAVRDDGAGIDPEKIKTLFQMFRQLNSTRLEGLGVGLALARKLVELHGGRITASSEGPGHGAEFILYLPLQVEKSGVNTLEKRKERVRLDGCKVLVVDDNLDAARSLDMLLQMLGAQPRLAHDGLTALEQLETFTPDVILLDIGLPDMDGYEVARNIRAQACHQQIKIIAVTGFGQNEDRQRSLLAGINEHLVKPINLNDIEMMLSAGIDDR